MIKQLKKAFVWYYMLNKRLIKKIGFLLILATIPLLTFSFTNFVDTEETGILRIALVAEDAEDESAKEIIADCESSTAFAFEAMDSVEDARIAVENGSVDAAWIFSTDFDGKVESIVDGGDESLVTVYAVDDGIFFRASREKIFSVFLPKISYAMYVSHTSDMLPEEATVSEEELNEYYLKYGDEEKIIDFAFLDSEQAPVEDVNFLTSTVRGLLAAVMLLCGLASTMYFISDEKKGTYSWLTSKKRLTVLLSSNFAALFMAGVFVAVSLYLSHNFTSLLRETVALLLFALCASAFCAILGAIFGSVGRLSLVLPTMLLASLVLCPVFFNINIAKPIQVLLPPYLYLYAVNDIKMVKWMVLYAVCATAVAYILYCVVRNKEVPSLSKKRG